MDKLSCRRLFAWVVLCCTLTALCGLGRSFGLFCIIASIFTCPLLVCWHRSDTAADDANHSLTVIVIRLILLLLPFFSFIYAASIPESQTGASKKSAHKSLKSARFANSQQTTIKGYCGKRIILLALVERVIREQSPPAQILIVSGHAISFPYERSVDGRVCFLVSNPTKSLKVTNGDLIAVTCYLRSSRFSLNNSHRDPACSYLEEHKKSFDAFSFVGFDDINVLPKLKESLPFDQSVFCAAGRSIQPLICFCREQITESHRQFLGPDNGALLTSMVLGQNAVDLPKTIIDNFRDVGLSHIVAASGFNLTVVILVTYWLLRPLNLPGNSCEYACLAMIATYVVLAGLSSSIARAALMSTFILLSRMTQRRMFVGSALAAALILTWLPSPQALCDVGLQLSYVATIGIIAGARSLGQWLNSRPGWFLQQCADTFAVTIIAQLSVLPIQLYYFGTIGLAFLPANLLVVPLVAPVTVLGFVASLLILAGSTNPLFGLLLFPLVNRIDQILQFPLTYIIWLTTKLSSLQFAKLHIRQPSINNIAIYYALIVGSLFLLRFPDQKLTVVILVSIAIACLIFANF